MSRAEYLRDSLAPLLGGARYAVLPSAREPRLLVPLGAAKAAATAVRHATEAHGPSARLKRDLVAAAFRVGAGALLLRHRLAEPGPGLAAHLSTLLGRPVLLSVHIGPDRANRKPVVQVLDRDGSVLAFAKLGVDPLTAALVDAEAVALERLSTVDAGVVVPELLHHGDWRGHRLLVQRALPVWLPRARVAAAEVLERVAMASLARALGTTTVPYVDGPHHASLGSALSTLDDPRAAALSAVLEKLAGPVEHGCWHGAWNGGNAAVLADRRVLVWDWERFATGVPVGFDALHRTLQTAITRHEVAPLSAASNLVWEGGVVAAAYLIELGTRYLRDRQDEAGARLGRIEDWLIPALSKEYS